MKLLQEFREFAVKGNVVDLAVGVIIGAAFGKIVSSLVADLIMPLVGIFLGGLNYSALVWEVGDAKITYGKFIQAIINFVIIAFVIFLLVRTVNNMQKRMAQEAKAAPPPEAPADVQLLAEIRDLLKANLQDGQLAAGPPTVTPER